MIKRIDIVGGGPGGLYLAVLLRESTPRTEVRVWERDAPADTFGFGVGFTARTLARLGGADAQTRDGLVAAATPVAAGEFRLGAGVARLHTKGAVAIERARLLAVLAERAERLGVQIEVGARVDAAALDADLIVAADGATSATRGASFDAYGVREETRGGRYLWCGCDVSLSTTVYTARCTDFGSFVVHAYPYRDDRATVLVECDEATWAASGMALNDTGAPAGGSDERSLQTLGSLFADLLDGQALIGNRTRWRRFTTVSCERWTARNVTLLGDAAHTAHFSVGSGTKLAMEDAIAFAEAVAGGGDASEVSSVYEQRRRGEVERIQRLAHRSQLWWDAFPARANEPASRVALSFLTRTGAIDLPAVRQAEPALLAEAVTALPQAPGGRRLAESPDVPALDGLDGLDDAYGREADSLVERAEALCTHGERKLRISLDGAIAPLDLCERLRLAEGFEVVGEFGDPDGDLALSALLTGRIDFVTARSASDRSLALSPHGGLSDVP